MAATVAAVGVPYVAMHWRASSQDMDRYAAYEDVVAEVVAELGARIERLTAGDIDPGRIPLDPGFGFAKRPVHDWTLPAHLGALRELGFPVLVGASRKRFIAAALSEVDAAQVPPTARDTASAAVSALAAAAGAFCVRVHDVRASLDAVRMAAAHGERLDLAGPARPVVAGRLGRKQSVRLPTLVNSGFALLTSPLDRSSYASACERTGERELSADG